VPDHMATTSAFSDLLGADASHSASDFQAAPPPPAFHAPDAPAAKHSPVPDYELPPSWRDRDEPESEVPAPAASTRGAAPSEPGREGKDASAYPPPASRPLQIPVYQERDQAPNKYEMMPTAAPPTGDIEVLREPELQESAAEATRNTIVDDIAPGLIPNLQQFLQQEAEQTSRAKQAAEPAPVEGAPRATPQRDQSAIERLSDAAFEARVAAAMAAYGHPLDAAKPVRSAGPVPAPTAAAAEVPGHMADRASERVQKRGGPVPKEVEPAAEEIPAPAVENHTPVRPPMGVPASAKPSGIAPLAGAIQTGNQPAPVEEGPGSEVGFVPAPFPEVASSDNHVSAPSSIEASALAAAAGAEAGTDPKTIAQAVQRVMERLKPELVDEIVRELKSKK
jgi:hypothetical protein